MEKKVLKKFQLRKPYPGSPKLNSIVEYRQGTYPEYFHIDSGIRFSSSQIEDYPEFWEEISPKYIKVLRTGTDYTTHPRAEEYGCTNYQENVNTVVGRTYKVVKEVTINENNFGYVLEFRGKHWLKQAEGTEPSDKLHYEFDQLVEEAQERYKENEGLSNYNLGKDCKFTFKNDFLNSFHNFQFENRLYMYTNPRSSYTIWEGGVWAEKVPAYTILTFKTRSSKEESWTITRRISSGRYLVECISEKDLPLRGVSGDGMGATEKYMLEDYGSGCKIQSIRRNSDNTIFSLGDYIKKPEWSTEEDDFILKKITKKDGIITFTIKQTDYSNPSVKAEYTAIDDFSHYIDI